MIDVICVIRETATRKRDTEKTKCVTYLHKDLPDNISLDILSKDLNAGEVQADATKQAAKDAQAKADSDNELRATWWAMARDGVGTAQIPTLNYLINQGTLYDDYPTIMKKILNGIAPTDTEWEAYDATFVIP